MLLALMFLHFYWEAQLISYLTARKTILPFKNVEDMYENTDFRIALIPSTTYEDNFKYSNDPKWVKVYEERFKPHIEEYMAYENYLTDMAHFIKNDYATALYDSFDPIR